MHDRKEGHTEGSTWRYNNTSIMLLATTMTTHQMPVIWTQSERSTSWASRGKCEKTGWHTRKVTSATFWPLTSFNVFLDTRISGLWYACGLRYHVLRAKNLMRELVLLLRPRKIRYHQHVHSDDRVAWKLNEEKALRRDMHRVCTIWLITYAHNKWCLRDATTMSI